MKTRRALGQSGGHRFIPSVYTSEITKARFFVLLAGLGFVADKG
jgi:hypothetical protein